MLELISSWGITKFIFNCFLYAVWCIFFNCNLERRFSKAVTYVFQIIYYVPFTLIQVSFTELSIVRTLSGPVLLLLLTICLYTSHWTRNLLAVLTVVFLMIICELAIGYTMMTPEQIVQGIKSFPVMAQIVMDAGYLSLTVLGLLLFTKMNKPSKYTPKLPISVVIIVGTLFICQYILMTVFFQLAVRDPHYQGNIEALIATGMGIIADFGLLVVINRQLKLVYLEQQNIQIKQLLAAQKNYYAQLSAQYETAKKIRHDIDNHLHSISIMINNKEFTKAEEYTQLLKDRLGETPSDAHPLLEAFLRDKKIVLESSGITLNYDNGVPCDISLTDVAIIAIIGNLLDNAVEACSHSSKRKDNRIYRRIQ